MYRFCPTCNTVTQHFAGTAVYLPGLGVASLPNEGPHCYPCVRQRTEPEPVAALPVVVVAFQEGR